MRRFQVGWTIAAALVLAWQLMLPPVVGVANNGDFGKVIGYFGLGAPREHEYEFADTRYTFDSKYRFAPGFYSSELLFAPPALAINALLSKDGHFDLRAIGFVHGTVFLVGFALFLSLIGGMRGWRRWVAAGAALGIFCDVGYAAYLNSFYMDVSAYLAVLLAAVFFGRAIAWRRRTDAMAAVVCCFVLVASKPGHGLLALPLAALLVRERRLFSMRWQPVAALAALLILAGAASTRYGAQRDDDARRTFSVLFIHVLPHTADPDRSLEELGLDRSYRQYFGQSGFSDRTPLATPAGVAAFAQRVPYSRLAGYFLSHPVDAYRTMRLSLEEAGRERPMLGNFDVSAGLPPWSESQAFALWSSAKRAVLFHRGARYLTCFGLLLAGFGTAMYRRWHRIGRGGGAAGAALAVIAVLEMLVPALADAIDIPRHFLLFYVACDLIVLTTVCLLMIERKTA